MTKRFAVRSAALLLSLFLSCAAAAPERRHERARSAGDHAEPAPDPYPSRYEPLPRRDIWIAGAVILDGAGHRFADRAVLVRDGRIVELSPDASDPPPDVTVIDGRGRWLTPGIIVVHSHDGTYVAPSTANDSEASEVSEISDPIAAGAWVEHSITVQDPSFYRALESGVTTLQVLPGSIPLIGGRSVVLKPVPATTVQAMKFPGAVQGVKMTCGENARGYFGSKGRAPNSRMGAVEILRDAFGRARHEAGEGGRRRGDQDAQTLSGILAGTLPVHVHCYRADEMAVMLDLAREFGFRIAAFHHAAEAYKIAPLLAQSGTCVAVWPDWWGFKTEAADAVRANAAIVEAAGGCVALHSDTPLTGQHLNLEVAKAMASGRRAGIPVAPEAAIRWITSNPAKILGLGDRIGSIAAGKNADLVLWSGDPFSVYSKAEKVFVDGALVFDRSDPARQPRSDFEVGRIGREQR